MSVDPEWTLRSVRFFFFFFVQFFPLVMTHGIVNTGSTRWSGLTKRFGTNNMVESGTKTITQIRPFPTRREILTYIFCFFQVMVFLHRQFFNKRFLLKYKVTTKRLWQIHGCTFFKYSERAFTKNYGKQTSILVGELPEESEQFRFFRASRLANLNLQILKVLFHIRNERW